MRVLVVTNLTPDARVPARGSFVRDQVRALREAGVGVELFSFPVGKRYYGPATMRVRRLLLRERFDLVHAHYGLAGWCAALAGARPLVVTFHGTDVRHPTAGRLSRRLARRIDLVAGASKALFAPESGRPGLPPAPGRTAVLPCGADLERFRALPKRQARRRLGLDEGGRYLFFPAATGRPEKRHDRARQLARLAGAQLLEGGDIAPELMPEWINAANAVLVTSDNEGFGLVAVEALGCEVPVLSTQVGIAPSLLAGVDGCLCAPFDPGRWTEALAPHLEASDPRVEGRSRASWFSDRLMAERVLTAHRELLQPIEAGGVDAARGNGDRGGDLA
jgi:teichuronic acid biosynthesis glycosyltransferase TuaC